MATYFIKHSSYDKNKNHTKLSIFCTTEKQTLYSYEKDTIFKAVFIDHLHTSYFLIEMSRYHPRVLHWLLLIKLVWASFYWANNNTYLHVSLHCRPSHLCYEANSYYSHLGCIEQVRRCKSGEKLIWITA